MRSIGEQQYGASAGASAAPGSDVLPAGTAPGTGARRLLRHVASWLWVCLCLPFALPAAPAFAIAAVRLRSRALGYEAAGYFVATVAWVALAAHHGAANTVGVVLALVTTLVAVVRAVMLRRRVFFPGRVAPQPTPSPQPRAGEGTAWTPTFPAQELPRDPNDPSTWVAPVACTGTDRHALSVTPRHAALLGIAGVVLIAFDVHFRVYGRGLGAGIGLALAPVVAALFARWVDGPVLYYRSWGRVHELRLDTVTAVAPAKATGGALSVLLSAPGLSKPLRVSLRNRGYVMPPAARDHLRGWMSGPHVQWAPSATALFDAHTVANTGRARRQLRVLRIALGVVLPLAAIGGRVAIAYVADANRAIPGAAGYYRFAGPHAKLLPVGRPWGAPCQPLRFEVDAQTPDWVYGEVAGVVNEARRDGLNVTLATRDLRWFPQSLYYPPGQSPLSTRPVPIFWRTGAPPHRRDGAREHITLGWDATVDADGRHEDLTTADGVLWMRTLHQPQAVRRSVRQLIALTQGILRTTRHDSGIAEDTSNDQFSVADVNAMKLMSGCRNSVPPVVP